MKIRTIGLGLTLSMFGCGANDGAPTSARVRVAHLSPDAPPVDVCLAPAGTGKFAGPVLGGGIAYGHVTQYLDVDPGAYDVRLVAPGAADCTTALGNLPDITDLPELRDGSSTTIAAIGTLAQLELRAYADADSVDADSAKLRFIHASPGTPNVDVGLGGGVAFTPVFANVAFGGAQAHDDGYVTTGPLADAELSARATGSTTDVLSIKPAKLAPGTIATAFAIGQIGNASAPLQVLVCADNAEPAGGLDDKETPCALTGAAPERAHVRVAHLSPDAPAVDICITTAGGEFGQPLLASLGARVGLAYPQVTQYVDLPLASYDVRVILATETTCANPAVPDTKGVTLAQAVNATVAAIGDVDVSGAAIADPRFRLAVFTDSLDVAPDKAKLRFLHVSPGTPAVDVGIYQSHGFVKLFGNVDFGHFAVHGGIDPIGYLEADPLTAPVAARLAGGSSDALLIPSVTLAGGTVSTAFAIGNKTGQGTNPLRVLLCADGAATTTLLASCVQAP
jgi:hypothetical protein